MRCDQCIPEWFVCLALVVVWLQGFLLAWALNNQDKPIWQGVLDGLSLRFVWGRFVR
jgi:hypothetical protein